MDTETTMQHLPTPAIRNAIAFVDYFGNFARGTHTNTRLDAQRWENGGYVWVAHNEDLDQRRNGCIKFYSVTDAGREVAAKGALSKTLAWLTEQGFKFEGTRNGRLLKTGCVNGFRHEDGRTAWISNSQSDTSCVYVNYPRDHPSYRIGSTLTFTAKAG